MKKKLHKLRKNNVDSKKLESFFTYLLHLNKYETAPNFIQLPQNLTFNKLWNANGPIASNFRDLPDIGKLVN